MQKILLSFLLLLTTACAKNNQAFSSHLYLDNMESFSADYQNKIVVAIQKINQDAGGEFISFSKNSSNQKPLVLINGPTDAALAHSEPLEYRCLITIDENNAIVNNSNPIQTDLRLVLLHEIGHCYHLGHDDSSFYNIMNSQFGGTDSMNPGQVSIILNNLQNFAKSLMSSEP
jgi:hypothetical protein